MLQRKIVLNLYSVLAFSKLIPNSPERVRADQNGFLWPGSTRGGRLDCCIISASVFANCVVVQPQSMVPDVTFQRPRGPDVDFFLQISSILA